MTILALGTWFVGVLSGVPPLWQQQKDNKLGTFWNRSNLGVLHDLLVFGPPNRIEDISVTLSSMGLGGDEEDK